MEFNSLLRNIETIEIDDLQYLEKDLSFNELASLALLLYGEERTTAEFALQKLLVMSNTNASPSDLLSTYARSVNKEKWRTYIVEALAIINARRVLRKLGLKWELVRNYYLPHIASLYLDIHPLLKALYKMCDSLTPAQAGRLIFYINENHRPLQEHFRFYNQEILEIFLLDWITRQIVSVGDREINNFRIEILLQYSKEEDLDEIKTILLDAIEINAQEQNAKVLQQNSKSLLNESATKRDDDDIIAYNDNINVTNENHQCQVNEIKNAENFESSDRYKINYKTAGKVLIINQQNFTSDSDFKLKARNGTKYDKDALKKTFSLYGYEPVIYDDLTHTEILNVIEETAKRSILCDSFIVCILSHGFDGGVYGSNCKPVWISDIEQKLTSEFLENKPKILIIQACQAKNEQTSQTKNEKSDAYQAERKGIAPNKFKDILKAIATVPGFASLRHTEHGSWFIQSLCKAIENYNHAKPFHDILTAVNREVSKLRGKNTDHDGHDFMMMPQFTSTLTHDFFLPCRKQTN